VAVAGDPSDPAIFYFGACAGGIWKTTSAGTYWRNVSDGFLNTAAIGAIAVAASDPSVVYAGTGEACTRNDVSHGDGVYRSSDGGHTWSHLGLGATRHIARVRVHPSDPDVAWVAALGDIFGTNPERGVYKTRDGGRTWDLVLHRSDKAGAADLIVDPRNPRVLFATIWEGRRTPWSMSSGGPDSSIYRSMDGGDTWTEITSATGLPKGLKGRMGVAVAPARPGRVWALIEAADGGGGLYRSEDFGEIWERVSEDHAILGRPWYYSHITADPKDPETIWAQNIGQWRSHDGGRHFSPVPTPHGDYHDLWIDPGDTRRLIVGNDGGACISFDGGGTFSSIYNQPTAAIYHLALDDRFPYRVYGTQQDNSAISVPSRSRKGAISWNDCYRVGHSESGHIVVDPKDNDVVYSGAVGSSPGGGGCLLRYDHKTEQIRIVTVWPEYFFGEGEGSQRHRFQWTFPLRFSPHDPHALYACGERVFRSRDDGHSWEPVSPDLTRNDSERTQASGGPITKDTSGAEHYCTIYAFAESPHEPGVLWAGSDDGLIHISRDGGQAWKNVTPHGLPEWATVTCIEISPHDASTAYACALRYKLQDRTPYLFKTTDYGDTWTWITGGIPSDEFTRIIRADPDRPGLLYAGTETRPWVSLDDGASWSPLSLNLPPVPIYDLAVKGADLVAATHGRGFWILDDVGPLRQLPAEDGPRLFAPAALYRYPTPNGFRQALPGVNYMAAADGAAFLRRRLPDGSSVNEILDGGTNPPDGLTVYYWLDSEAPHDALELAFLHAGGEEVVSFTPGEPEKVPPSMVDAAQPMAGEGEETETELEEPAVPAAEPPEPPKAPEKRWFEKLPTSAGLNRFTWDLRCRGYLPVADDKGERRPENGYIVPPGTYGVRLRVGDRTLETTFELRKDPRVSASDEQLREQYDFLIAIRDKLTATNGAIGRIRAARAQAEIWTKRPGETPADIVEAAKAAAKALNEVEKQLTNTDIKHDVDRLQRPAGLDRKLGEIPTVVAGPDAPPTRQALEVFEKIAGQVDEALAQLHQVAANEVARLNELIASAGLPAVDVGA
jgi:photosystem II stability/assembly factor-like uncharacterized protein